MGVQFVRTRCFTNTQEIILFEVMGLLELTLLWLGKGLVNPEELASLLQGHTNSHTKEHLGPIWRYQ